MFGSFAFDATALKDIASVETLDRIASNVLGLRLEVQALVRASFGDLRDYLVRASERWRDLDVGLRSPALYRLVGVTPQSTIDQPLPHGPSGQVAVTSPLVYRRRGGSLRCGVR